MEQVKRSYLEASSGLGMNKLKMELEDYQSLKALHMKILNLF